MPTVHCCCCWASMRGNWCGKNGDKKENSWALKSIGWDGWRGERLDGYIRWWWFLAMRQVDLGRRSTSPIFGEPFGDLLPVCRVVLVHAAGGGFWGSHKLRVRLSLLQLHIFHWWCLLRSLFCAASTWAPGGGYFSDGPSSSALSLTTLILLCGQAFLLSRHTPGEFFYGYFPPLVARLMVAFAES